jgi:hypothetical protein
MITAFAALSASIAIAAEAHLGFELESVDGKLIVRKVYMWSPASEAGVKQGDVFVEVVGAKARTIDELKALVAKKKPNDPIRIRFNVADKKDPVSKTIRLEDLQNVQTAIAREKDFAEATAARIAEQAALQKEMEERERAELRERLATHGPVQILAGVVGRDRINQPVILLSIKNHAQQDMDAIEINVALFDKFDRPVEGIFGTSHEKTFLVQQIVDAGEKTEVILRAPWHDAVGKAKVSVVQYLPVNGRPVEVPDPEVIVVKQH